MLCTKCGRQIEGTAVFCPSCGQATGVGSGMSPVQRGPRGAGAQAGMQPRVGGPVPKIPNHLGWAIAALVLFWPTGIPALVYSLQVDNKAMYGDIQGAWESSAKAKKWATISMVALAAYILLIVLIIVLAYLGTTVSS